MIWLVCGFLCILLLVAGARMFLHQKTGISRAVIALGCLFAATYVLYLPAFITAYGTVFGAVGDLLQVFRVVSLDADLTQFYSVIAGKTGHIFIARGYVIALGLLHVALPTVSALTAVTVLLRWFSSVQLFCTNHRRRPMFIFSEANERALHLAKSLEKISCDIVFAGSTPEHLNGELSGKRKPICKEESIDELDIKHKKKKDIYFFCVSQDENLCLSHLLHLTEKYTALPESEQEHIHIYQFAKHQDFSVFVDSSDKGMLDVHCINEYEILVYNLLDQYPLMKFATKGVHVLLHGLSDINVMALRSIIWCGQISGFDLRISVVGKDMKDQHEDLIQRCPGLFSGRYDIRFYHCENEKEMEETISRECKDANYIIVSEETDNKTMERGIALRRLFYKLDHQFAACPPIFCYIQEDSKAHLIKNLTTAEANPKRKMRYDLIPFGNLNEVFTYARLVDSPLEKLAKNVHLAYEEIFSDGEIDVQQALKRYNIFEVNKRSNRANALHIRYKLNMLGLDYTDDPDVQEVSLEDSYTTEALEKMAYSEHSRWMAFLQSEGWTTAQREAVLAYQASGISKGRHNCPLLKMHPYICDYEKLKNLSMELENKDTTVYDKELVVRIPEILGDKWNVIGKRYKIVRMQ